MPDARGGAGSTGGRRGRAWSWPRRQQRVGDCPSPAWQDGGRAAHVTSVVQPLPRPAPAWVKGWQWRWRSTWAQGWWRLRPDKGKIRGAVFKLPRK